MKLEKRDYLLLVYFGIITALMVAVSVSCTSLDVDENIIWTTQRIVSTTAVSLVTGLVTAVVCGLILVILRKRGVNVSICSEPLDGPLPRWTYLACPVIFTTWLPAFLAFYPGLCNYDAEGYFFQFTYNAFNNHHPIAYTLIVASFYRLGKLLFDSYTVGIAVFTLLQMLLLAFSMTVFIRTVYRACNRKWLFWGLTALFGLHPMNAYMSVTMTKDIYFAAGILIAFSALYSRLCLPGSKIYRWKEDCCLVIGFIMVVLFRSNGRYCILATLLIECLFLVLCKSRRRILLRTIMATIIGFAIGMLLVSALDKLTNAQEVDKREMFSLPAQQIARVVHFHEEELSEETMTQIQTLIWPSSLYLYNPRTARFVKQDVISYEILHYPIKYLKLYLNLFQQYPGDYVNAFLSLYAGFLNPWDQSHVRINEDFDGVLADGFHYIQTAFTVTERFLPGLTPLSQTLHRFYCWYSDNDVYLKVPVLSLLFVPGVYLWIILYSLGLLLYRKKGIICIPCALIFSYFLTFFLGPTVQLRYIFPIMICTPGILLFILINIRRDRHEINHSDTLL